MSNCRECGTGLVRGAALASCPGKTGAVMGQEEFPSADRTRLVETARALVARGESRFSITRLCAEAGVARDVFRDHFPGRAALMAALDAPSETSSSQIPKAETTQEPAVSTPDAWLERRRRVFERALNALEARAETSARETARALAAMEDRLTALGAPVPVDRRQQPRATVAQATALPPQPSAPEPQDTDEEAPQKAVHPLLPALPLVMPSKEEMAELLQQARGKVQVVPEEAPRPRRDGRMRWLAVAGLSVVAVFLCAGLLLGDPARATQSDGGSGVTVRRIASAPLDRLTALADSGDAAAQARLALAYLRGEGVAADPVTAARWLRPSALAGQPVAQYLLGALHANGDGVAADPAQAFGWFAKSAARGNVKAMHNLAIAYAQGEGTAKDAALAAEWFLKAAERGYVDSAFDLAVLYERGLGVPQDLKLAMKWYGVAALAGDAPSQERAAFLRQQVDPAQARAAADAAVSVLRLSPLAQANRLPDL